MDSYFAWISFDGGCCGYYNTTTPSDPVMCDKPGEGEGRGGGSKEIAYNFGVGSEKGVNRLQVMSCVPIP